MPSACRVLWIIGRHRSSGGGSRLLRLKRTSTTCALMSVPSLLGAGFSLLTKLGRGTSNAFRCGDFLRGPVAAFPAFWRNLPAIPSLAGRDGLASDCQHSHLVAGFLALCRGPPDLLEEARKCATSWLRFCLKRAERRKPLPKKGHFWRVFSNGHFRGSHQPRSRSSCVTANS